MMMCTFFFARRETLEEIEASLSRVSSLGFEFNSEISFVYMRRRRKRRMWSKRKGRKERRTRKKRNDETRKGVRVFDRSQRSGKRSRREGDSGTVIAGRSEIHPNGGAFSPRKKKNTFVRGFCLWPNSKARFFSSLSRSLSLSLSLSPSRFPLSRAEEDATDGLSSPSPVFIRRFRVTY